MSSDRFDVDTMLRAAADAVRESTPALRHVVVIAVEHDHNGIARAAMSSAPGEAVTLWDALSLHLRSERAIKDACPEACQGW